MMHDLGFQLSVLVIGIGLFGQYAYHLTSKSQSRLMKSMIASIGMTLGATRDITNLCCLSVYPLDRSGCQYIGTPLLATVAVPVSMLGLLAGLIGSSFVESVLFILADVRVELSMLCLKPPMLTPLSVVDVLDVWIAFVCLIVVVFIRTKWGNSLLSLHS